jgi:peptidylprolyl isomerase domain and WD repeat-containing protein 1
MRRLRVWCVARRCPRGLAAFADWLRVCSDEEAGPAPPPGLDKPKKKRKVLEFQHVYLDDLPCATMYERSFMHQNTVTHVQWTKSDFLLTASSEASCDTRNACLLLLEDGALMCALLLLQGHIKFWKKKSGEIEFIKRYAAHLGPVTSLAAAPDGAWLASISSKDCVVNVFDVVNFDMVNRIQLDFSPSCIEWVHKNASSKPTLAVGCIGILSEDFWLARLGSFTATRELHIPTRERLRNAHPTLARCLSVRIQL